jgi:hypothetical protein
VPGRSQEVKAPDLKLLQEERLSNEEYIREYESRVAELEEKEKYWKMARKLYPGKTDEEIQATIEERLSKLIEVDNGE